MRAAAVQLNSEGDKARNLDTAERLVRAAAADGAELVALPEKWNLLAGGEELLAGAEPLAGPSLTAARGWARELGIHLLAGSIAERGEGEKAFNTSVLIGPDGHDLATYRKIHMFDVDAGGVSYRESAHEQPGSEMVTASLGELIAGLTVCYDLRFPELFRILALRGARLLTVPSAFTTATGRDHWEVLLRARAIENQAFLVAPNQIGAAPPHFDSYGHSAIIDPWGTVLATAPDEECFVAADLDLAAQEQVRESLPSLANRRPQAYAWPQADGGTRLMAKAPPVDKRRQILDAAIRVFARQGFHATRVSDIADEAGVAYGLVYHYFRSKDEVLNELFVERWSLLLSAIEETDRTGETPRAKLAAVAAFIVDSYRHDPELMKVIIVEVTRAANSFGRTHLPEIRRAYQSIAKIVEDGQKEGAFRDDVAPLFASMSFYGAIEQLLSGWIFDVIPASDTDFEEAKELVVTTICDGLGPR